MATTTAIAMIFLTGIFVTLPFARPFLNWSVEHKSHVIQSGFWIYLRVTSACYMWARNALMHSSASVSRVCNFASYKSVLLRTFRVQQS